MVVTNHFSFAGMTQQNSPRPVKEQFNTAFELEHNPLHIKRFGLPNGKNG